MVQNNADKIGLPYVINLKDLKSYLANYHDGTQYSVEQMDEIYQTLQNAARKDVSAKSHIENIKATQNDIENGICPRCGGSLVLRSGQYGQFYGCSQYPNCKFTKKF